MNEIKVLNRKPITIKIFNSRLKHTKFCVFNRHVTDLTFLQKIVCQQTRLERTGKFFQLCPYQRWQKCPNQYQNIKKKYEWNKRSEKEITRKILNSCLKHTKFCVFNRYDMDLTLCRKSDKLYSFNHGHTSDDRNISSNIRNKIKIEKKITCRKKNLARNQLKSTFLDT